MIVQLVQVEDSVPREWLSSQTWPHVMSFYFLILWDGDSGTCLSQGKLESLCKGTLQNLEYWIILGVMQEKAVPFSFLWGKACFPLGIWSVIGQCFQWINQMLMHPEYIPKTIVKIILSVMIWSYWHETHEIALLLPWSCCHGNHSRLLRKLPDSWIGKNKKTQPTSCIKWITSIWKDRKENC